MQGIDPTFSHSLVRSLQEKLPAFLIGEKTDVSQPLLGGGSDNDGVFSNMSVTPALNEKAVSINDAEKLPVYTPYPEQVHAKKQSCVMRRIFRRPGPPFANPGGVCSFMSSLLVSLVPYVGAVLALLLARSSASWAGGLAGFALILIASGILDLPTSRELLDKASQQEPDAQCTAIFRYGADITAIVAGGIILCALISQYLVYLSTSRRRRLSGNELEEKLADIGFLDVERDGPGPIHLVTPEMLERARRFEESLIEAGLVYQDTPSRGVSLPVIETADEDLSPEVLAKAAQVEGHLTEAGWLGPVPEPAPTPEMLAKEHELLKHLRDAMLIV